MARMLLFSGLYVSCRSCVAVEEAHICVVLPANEYLNYWLQIQDVIYSVTRLNIRVHTWASAKPVFVLLRRAVVNPKPKPEDGDTVSVVKSAGVVDDHVWWK